MKTCKAILALVLVLTTAYPGRWVMADFPAEINMILGDVETIEVNKLTRVSVTNPEIADISDAKDKEVSVIAKKSGQTILFVWDESGKHTVSINVAAQDLGLLKNRIERLLSQADIPNLNLEANPAEGRVVISGNIVKDKKTRLDKILEPYSEHVMNITREEVNQDIIQIDMQITELSETLDKNLGFDWQGGAGNDLKLDYNETGLPTGGSKDWFKFGQFDRTTAIVNTVNLMINEGKARDLARPRILVTSGKEATINVGGEVPITETTTTSTAGGTTSNSITFKQYGVTLTVTPVIKEGKIDVTMNLQISDLDKTFFIAASSTNDVAYKTRSAQTQLLLDDRQTVVFAGLIRYNDSMQTKRVPGLSKIPIIGMLFRNQSKNAPDEAKELVITLTPTIMRDKNFAKDEVDFQSDRIKAFEKEVDMTQGYARKSIGSSAPTSSVSSAGQTAAKQETAVNLALSQQQGSASFDQAAAMGANTPTPDLSVPATGNINPYVRDVQMKISKAITYPTEALRNNWQGTSKLKLRIQKDGQLAQAEVVESSGFDIFDKDALNSAKISAPFEPFAADMKGDYVLITIPIVYSQNSPTPDTQTSTATY